MLSGGNKGKGAHMMQDDGDMDHSREDAYDPFAMPSVIPVFPLTGAILLPGNTLPLNIFEPRYLAMVRDALTGTKLIGMIQPREQTGGTTPCLYDIGGVGRIEECSETPDGRFLIALKGISRFRIIEELSATTPYRQVNADWSAFTEDQIEPPARDGVARERLLTDLKAYLDRKGLEADFDAIAQSPDAVLVNTLSMILPVASAEKQALLEAGSLADRGEMLSALLTMETFGSALGDGVASDSDEDGPAPVN